MKILSKDFVLDCVQYLDSTQEKLFRDYGVRQIKYMFENDPVNLSIPPKGSVFVGLSQPFLRWTAIDYESKVRYGYFKGQNPEWSQADEFKPDMKFDRIEDFKFIYDTFNLKDYEKDVLTHVHRNYIEWNNTDS